MQKTPRKMSAAMAALYSLPISSAAAFAAEQPKQPPPKLAYGDDILDESPEAELPLPDIRPPPGPETEPERKYARNYFNIGVGMINVPDYNGSKDNVFQPAGVLRGRIKGFSFSTRGTNLSVDLLREKRKARVDWKFGPLINLRSERSTKVKNLQVRALGKLDKALELGVTMGVQKSGIITSKYDQVGAKLTVLKDVSGAHGGMVFSPSLEYGTPLSKKSYIGLTASTSFGDKKFGRYYSDISIVESLASGLPVYQKAGTKGGFSKYALGIAMVQSLSGDLRKGASLIGGVQFTEMLGRYADTPVVRLAGDPKQWSVGLGVAYSF